MVAAGFLAGRLTVALTASGAGKLHVIRTLSLQGMFLMQLFHWCRRWKGKGMRIGGEGCAILRLHTRSML